MALLETLALLQALSGEPAAEAPEKRLASISGKAKKVVHAVADDCTNCHASKSGGGPLSDKTNGLCLSCHTLEDEALSKAHLGATKIEKTLCWSCHDPHASNNPKLIRDQGGHSPFADKMCEMCHEPAKDGKAVVKDPLPSACMDCHSDSFSEAQKPKAHASFCVECHDPHVSPRRAHLRGPLRQVCGECHDAPEKGHFGYQNHPTGLDGPSRRVPRLKAFDCAACHVPHGSALPSNLKVPKKDLCRTCHRL